MMDVSKLDNYSKKLLRRAEGIWNNMGLYLESTECDMELGTTKLRFKFKNITPSLAEVLVASMQKAFRRANIYWKDEPAIVVFANIPPMGSDSH